jgi:hypothetical protein
MFESYKEELDRLRAVRDLVYGRNAWCFHAPVVTILEHHGGLVRCLAEAPLGRNCWRALGPGLKRRIASRWHNDFAKSISCDRLSIFRDFLREKERPGAGRWAESRLMFSFDRGGYLHATWRAWEMGEGPRSVKLWVFNTDDEAAFLAGEPEDEAWIDAPVPE